MNTLDVVGIGFGPAAIAVATAIDDEYEFAPAEQPRLTARFLERAPDSAWQPNMLLAGTDIQHHFLRDYATPRNPRSRFTFPRYLLETDRFYQFTLMGNYVSRHEWSEYTRWVAEQITLPVDYGQEVVEVVPIVADGTVVAADVVSRQVETGAVSRHRTRNVIVSTGHTPYTPELFIPHLGDRVFHSFDYLPKMTTLPVDQIRDVAVVGAGQNAGEIILHLAGMLPNARIHSLARNAGFRMYNLGHFSNEQYFPEETEYFYALNAEQRARTFQESYSTNYAAVDPELSTAMYRAVYEDKHWGPGRFVMRKRTAIDGCLPTATGGYRLRLREVNTGALDELDADLVILCTGYREPRLPEVLAPFKEYADTDETGDLVVSRDFRMGVTPDCEVGLYLNGITEWRHGINSATSFSTMAVKGERILRDLQRHQTETEQPHDAVRLTH